MRSTRGLSLLLFVLFCACKGEIAGQFAWAATDDRDVGDHERLLLSTESYRIGRRRLYFFDYETVRWVYRVMDGKVDGREPFVVALYEAKNTPTPVEVDLREVPVELTEGMPIIRQMYGPLPAGRYLVKVAHKLKVVDQVWFEVVPPEGPGGPEDGDLEEDEVETSPDEIIRYSSGIGVSPDPGSGRKQG